jgi:hypothetical protein
VHVEDVARAASLADDVHATRLTAQLLSGEPARTPLAVAERLLAVQAQDARGVRLAIRARTEGLVASDLDRALGVERSLVITWLNRGTLHLVSSEDLPWLHALTAPRLVTGNARRLAQEGVTAAQAERGVTAVERALAADGPLTRGQLRERVARARVPVGGQALVHVLGLASLRGLIVRGPVVGAEQAYVLVRDWLGPAPRPPARERALAELARRYLAGHEPAHARDLARWAGLPVGEARAGLRAIAGELREGPDGLLRRRVGRAGAELPRPRLLGAFEPLLLGWCSRADVAGGDQARLIAGGVFRPFALVGGRAAATWSIRGGAVAIEPFARIPREVRRDLERDGEDVLRYLGLRSGGGR